MYYLPDAEPVDRASVRPASRDTPFRFEYVSKAWLESGSRRGRKQETTARKMNLKTKAKHLVGNSTCRERSQSGNHREQNYASKASVATIYWSIERKNQVLSAITHNMTDCAAGEKTGRPIDGQSRRRKRGCQRTQRSVSPVRSWSRPPSRVDPACNIESRWHCNAAFMRPARLNLA